MLPKVMARSTKPYTVLFVKTGCGASSAPKVATVACRGVQAPSTHGVAGSYVL